MAQTGQSGTDWDRQAIVWGAMPHGAVELDMNIDQVAGMNDGCEALLDGASRYRVAAWQACTIATGTAPPYPLRGAAASAAIRRF
mgnify:CR=1 FL=1